MIIRNAFPADADAIAAFWNPMIRNTAITFSTVEKPPVSVASDIVARSDAGLPFLVAEVDGDVVGFCTYAQFRGGTGYSHTMEHTIILAPSAQGSGMARALMDALENRALADGVHSLLAGISGENARAVAFHEKCGFQIVGKVPQAGRKFDRWMDLILMQKILGSH